MNNIDLLEMSCVVTGGAQGIGRAVAERCLASGARVCLWDQDAELLQSAIDSMQQVGPVTGAEVDVTDPDSVAHGVASALANAGKIDVLVNNAGIAGMNAPTWEYPVEEWRRVMSIDLDGVFLCSRAVMPHMIESGYGRVLNIASIAGKEGNPNAAAYSAAKAGVIALTKSLAKEVAQYDIAVNCMTPAAARTRIFDQMSEEHIEYMLSKIPRARFVAVEEVAAMAAWVVSAENSFTTGAVFDISGGRATY